MTDIKKDTLKNQLDDALRQGYDASLMINPELAVVQLNTIMDEQIIKAMEWASDNGWEYDRYYKNWFNKNNYSHNISSELLQIFKDQHGL